MTYLTLVQCVCGKPLAQVYLTPGSEVRIKCRHCKQVIAFKGERAVVQQAQINAIASAIR